MKYLVRFFGFLIDASASLFISLIFAFFIAYFEFIPLLKGFLFTWLSYYIICYIFFRKTIGQIIINYGIYDEGKKNSFIIRVILRESLSSFPAVLFLLFGWNYFAIGRFLFIALVCFLCVIFRKKTFRISLKKEYYGLTLRKRAVWLYLGLLVISCLARILNTSITQGFSGKDLPLTYWAPRPTVHSVNEYTEYLRENKQEINDYIIDLFDKYDHVILCERSHREMTQYDMIYNLITDKRFIDNVGCVFTEVGNVESRSSYNDFADRAFRNEYELDSCLSAFLVKENQSIHLLWPNTNWFQFLKRVYKFNHNNGKRAKILFADNNWIDKREIDNRDSIMANNIINTIMTDSISKSLIIMNYRHSYLTPGNCGYNIEEHFKGKVANVLINTGKPLLIDIVRGKETLQPIQNGKWDVAFEKISENGFAFDLNGSPFGEDSFDHFVSPWNKVSALKYKDMFTGVIYYEPLGNHIMSIGYPHMFDPTNITYIIHRAT